LHQPEMDIFAVMPGCRKCLSTLSNMFKCWLCYLLVSAVSGLVTSVKKSRKTVVMV